MKECVENTLLDLRDWTRNPEMSAAYFIPEFGTFVFHLKPLTKLVHIKIRTMRKWRRLGIDNGPKYDKLVEEFRRL